MSKEQCNLQMEEQTVVISIAAPHTRRSAEFYICPRADSNGLTEVLR